MYFHYNIQFEKNILKKKIKTLRNKLNTKIKINFLNFNAPNNWY